MLKKLSALIDISITKYLLKQGKCFLFLIIYTGATLIFPMFVSYIIDQGIMKCSIEKTVSFIIGMLIVGIVSVIFQYLQQMSYYKLGQELTLRIRKKLYAKILSTNAYFWDKNSVGDIILVVQSDVSTLETVLTSTVSNIVVNIIVAVGISIFLITTNWKCGLLILCTSVIFVCFQKAEGKKIDIIVKDLRKSMGHMAAFTNETIQNANDIHATGFTKYACKKFSNENKQVIKKLIVHISTVSVTQCIGTLFSVIGLFIVLGYGAFGVILGSMTIGTLFALTVYVQRLYGPIISLGNSYVQIKNVLPKIRKIINVLETPDVIPSGNYYPNHMLNGKIDFVNVNFKYENKKILNQFSLSIESGETIGIIGANGTGKSTLLKLLLSLRSSNSGDILLDDKPIMLYDSKYLIENIGYVSQDGFVISGSLREIIDPFYKLDDNEILILLKEFGLDISRFEKGMYSYIDENYRNISGGEVQKIMLARMFVENKSIYLFDEPTAAMDCESEKIICNILKNKLNNKTTIIVTHRPEILNICNKIIDISIK